MLGHEVQDAEWVWVWRVVLGVVGCGTRHVGQEHGAGVWVVGIKALRRKLQDAQWVWAFKEGWGVCEKV